MQRISEQVGDLQMAGGKLNAGLGPKTWPAPYNLSTSHCSPCEALTWNLQPPKTRAYTFTMQMKPLPRRYLALPVGNQARLLQPVLLVPAQGLEAAPQGHQAAVDGHALPAHS